jgi:hypothetical protein
MAPTVDDEEVVDRVRVVRHYVRGLVERVRTPPDDDLPSAGSSTGDAAP